MNINKYGVALHKGLQEQTMVGMIVVPDAACLDTWKHLWVPLQYSMLSVYS